MTTAQIDNAVRRILEVKFKLGSLIILTLTSRQRHRITTIRSTASSHELPPALGGVVTQRGNLLPLTKGDSKVSSIAVIGPLADSKRDMRGPWTLADDEKTAISVVEGIREKVGPV